jgi:hypothetical protein
MEINDTSLNESINNQRVSSSFQATTNNIIPEYNSLFNADNFHMGNECRHIHENNRYDNINDSEGDSQNNNDSQRKSNVNPLEISQEITKINMIKKDDISHMDNTNRDNYSYNNLNKEEEDDKIEKDEECEEEEEEEIDEEERYNENESNDNNNQNYTENNPQEMLDDNNSNSNANDTMSQIAYNIREGMDLMNLENNINDHCSNSSFVDNITLLNSYSNRNSSNINTNRNTNTNINNNNNNLNNRNSELIQNITNHLGNGNNNPLLSQNLNGFMPGQKKINNLQINNNNFEKNEFSKENESILSKQERVLSLSTELNEFEKFIQSPQYVNLEKTFLYANNLFLLKGENNFEIASDEGNEICHKLLDQIECLMVSMNIKGQNRDYRKNFTKAYFYLFEENKLCFLTEILDSAQENTPYIVVNDEQYTFSKEVLNCGNELFNSFCSMIMLLADTVKNIRDGLFYNEIYKIKDKIKLSLIDFDSKWVKYEEKYINELIEIEKKARKLILEGIKIENEITNYENKSKNKGKLLINDNKYNELRIKLINNILQLNKIANVNGKGRCDLPPEILFKAEKVLVTVSENQSKGMRNLALKIKNSLNVIRSLFHKYSKNIEGIDPQLKNNKDLSNYLLYFENKFELGKIYLLDNIKYNQLLFFSQIIEIICEKYNKYSIRELIENDDPSIFVSLPSILLLKAMNKEDQNICKEYITGLNDKNNESGKLFNEIKNMKKQIKKIIGETNKTYNILEKTILFDGTKEQLMIDKEIEKYIKNKEIISEIKKGLTNLSLHLQRYKPTQWNTFFQLAMDIKPLNKNDLCDDVNKTMTTTDNNINDFENDGTLNESNNNELDLISNVSAIESI